jgi:hypothetical protein
VKEAVCPITGGVATVEPRTGDWRRFHSPAAGGTYDITGSAAEDLAGHLRKTSDRARLLTWLVDQRIAGVEIPRVTTYLLEPSALPALPKVGARVERLYLALKHVLPTIDSSLPFEGNVAALPSDEWTSEQSRAYLRAWTASTSDEELRALVRHAVAAGLVSANRRIALTIAGWQYLEDREEEVPTLGRPIEHEPEVANPSARQPERRHETPTQGGSDAVAAISSPPPPKTVFISYSWDDEDHKQWVRELAERLVANGVHAHLDQWDVQYGDSLTQFMETALPGADFVLVICTPTYAVKSNGRAGGVGYEAQIISAQVASGLPRSKFVPVVRSGGLRPTDLDCSVPPHFQGAMAIDMRNDAAFDVMFEHLLRHIYGQPLLRRPPLGARPDFMQWSTATDAPSSVRLASFEVEGWELKSGVVQNELYPATFQIPEEAKRREVVPGDFVKVQFEYVYEDPATAKEMAGGGERMWLEVVGFNGPYLVGRLRNDPTGAVEHDLSFDSMVAFLPEHIISIDVQGEDAKAAR